MNNRLSHSSTSKFQECPTAWKYHYLDRLRSTTQSAALLFGTALDKAITAELQNKDKKAEEAFSYFWRFQEVNGVALDIPVATNIVYANSDFDKDLLNTEDIGTIKDKFQIEDPLEEIKNVYEIKKTTGFDGLKEEQKALLNFANWICLYHKGMLMIQTFRTEILPNIEEVLGVQEYVELKNGDGDIIIGYADLICKWKGVDGPVVLDFKTSSIEYEADKVLTSPQLTLYVHALNEKYKTRKAGFIVFNKHILKNKTKICSQCSNDGTGKRHKTCDAEINGDRCNGDWIETIKPSVHTQILIDEIPTQTEDVVLQNMDYINQAIKNGIFHRNFSSCVRPWGKCPFFNKCFKNSDEGLIKLEDKNEK